MNSQTEILVIFDEFGNELNVSWNDLLVLESREPNVKLYQRVLGDKPGTYWLVSARLDNVRMLLEIRLRKNHVTGTLSLGMRTDGIARDSHWELETCLKTFRDREPRLPANVETLVRKHVYFVPNVNGTRVGENVRPQFTLKTVSAEEAKMRLARVTTADASQLIKNYAGYEVEVIELLQAADLFCELNPDTEVKTMAVVKAPNPFLQGTIGVFFLRSDRYSTKLDLI